MKLTRKTVSAKQKYATSARLLVNRLKTIHRYYFLFGERQPTKPSDVIGYDWSDK